MVRTSILSRVFGAAAIAVGFCATSYAACLRDGAGSSRLYAAANRSSAVVATIPAKSCRLAIETASCETGSGQWCKASFDGKFGWVEASALAPRDGLERRSMNYYVLDAVYNKVAARHSRGYDLHKSYTQDLNYSTFKEIKAHYYKGGKWQFPGMSSESMCVAAVAEVIVESINQYVAATGDETPYDKLTAQHFSHLGGKKKFLKAHIYEFEGMGSKGAAHALERFNIGKQKTWPELVPGDLIKFSRSGRRPGHSTIFIAYVDSRGNVLERYSPAAVGFRFFSAQGSGQGADGKTVKAGMSFRNEFFDGKCAPDAGISASRCAVLGPDGKYGVNVGSLFYPSAWGVVGANYETEVFRGVAAQFPGVCATCAGPRGLSRGRFGAEIKAKANEVLNEAVDPETLPNWEQD